MGFRWLLSFKYLCFYIFMEVLHTQRFDFFVPKIVIYTLCYLLNCKKKRRSLKQTSPLEIAANVAEFNKHKFRNYAYYNQFQNWCNKSANSIAQITCTRASIPQCLRVVFLIWVQNCYFFLNCANILRRKRYSAPSPFIIILVNRGIWCYDSIYTAELIIYHSASAISATTIKIIMISSIIINFKG